MRREDTPPVAEGTPILSARGIAKSFGGRQVLKDVTFELHGGEGVLLQGSNGGGKTTLLNILSGYVEPDAGEIVVRTAQETTSFRFPRRRWRSVFSRGGFDPEHLAATPIGRRREGLVARQWQDVRLFKNLDLRSNLLVAAPRQTGEDPLRVFLNPGTVRLEESARASAVERRLQLAGLAGRERSNPERISLGEAKRVAILRALETQARVLLLDEPLNGLDSEGTHQLLGFLADVRGQNPDRSLIIVEHDARVLALLDFCSAVWTLHAGVLEARSVDGARAEIARRARSTVDLRLQAIAGPAGTVERKSLERGAVLTVVSRGGRSHVGPEFAVESAVADRGHRRVLGAADGTGISFSLRPGDVAVLEAPNGWGKSTLLDCLSGLTAMRSGVVRLAGKALDGSAHSRAQAGIITLRSGSTLFENLTVAENMALCRGRPESTGLDPEQVCTSLSGGERQRLAWEIAVSTPATVLLLDEPFAHLDGASIERAWARILAMPDRAVMICLPATSGGPVAGTLGDTHPAEQDLSVP